MANIEFTAIRIVKLLQELKPGKSAGLDLVPTCMDITRKQYAL